MKSKLSWITFIPLALAAGFFKLAQGFLPEGSVFGLSALLMEYIYMGAVALIFLFALLFCLIDKKIARYYMPHQNIPAGIFGLMLAFLLAVDGANKMMHVFSAGKVDVLSVVESVFAILAAVVFVVFGLAHTFRNKESKRFSLLNVMPAVLCAVRMIVSFVQFTTISIRLADVSSLICYVFATLFFYHYAIALSLITAKRAVKYCIIFGMPAAAMMIPYGVYGLVFNFDAHDILNNLWALEMLLFGLYILSFLIELTIFVKDQESIVIDDDKPAPVVSQKKVQGFIANNDSEDESDRAMESMETEQKDTEGYLYDVELNEVDDGSLTKEFQEDMEPYLTTVLEQPISENDDRNDSYVDKLDDIDKLIIEINEQSD